MIWGDTRPHSGKEKVLWGNRGENQKAKGQLPANKKKFVKTQGEVEFRQGNISDVQKDNERHAHRPHRG